MSFQHKYESSYDFFSDCGVCGLLSGYYGLNSEEGNRNKAVFPYPLTCI